MIKPVIALVSAGLLSLGSPLLAAPHGGGRHVGPPGGVAGPSHGVGRPGWGGGYGGARHIHGGYGGWYGGYWGPRVGVYYGGAGYWGGWPAVWGGSYVYPYSIPYAYGYGYPYGYAYGYSAAPVVAYDTLPTPSFVQQEPAAVATPQDSTPFKYWFYCTQPAGYYPYVKECSQPWLTVVPQAPGQQPTAPRVAP
jgi:hypothetical protein